ncbi:MAG TPA: phosphogluconate dehydrogenase C-terminal domain-containing protein [Gaiellaceae bacterium]|nr:phosphogluconate dehydrogenase C-terminal domain-containing protein [Gaiellaceae bacterium]
MPSGPSPLFLEETDPAALRDYFGSGLARQSVVNALVQGDEDDYALGERLSQVMWGPILRSHRITLEQMAVLEPALSETTVGTCIALMKTVPLAGVFFNDAGVGKEGAGIAALAMLEERGRVAGTYSYTSPDRRCQ